MSDALHIPDATPSERIVLGAAVINREALHHCQDLGLTHHDFHTPQHRHLWALLCDLAHHDHLIDDALVADRARTRPDLAHAAGLQVTPDQAALSAQQALHGTLSAPIGSTPEHVRIVRDAAQRRRLLRVCWTVQEQAQAGERPVEDILAEAERDLLGVMDAAHVQKLAVPADQVIRDQRARWDAPTAVRDGVPTGLDRLDRHLTGLLPGQLNILAARPGVGKSALALQIADRTVKRTDRRVLLVSLEMTDHEIADRLAARAGASLTRLERKPLARNDVQAIGEIGGRTDLARLLIADRPDQSADQVSALTRRLHARDGLGLVIVDYLQLLRWDGNPRANRNEQVQHQTRSLKVLAAGLDVPVLLLSQLSRQPESRPAGPPRLSDLRDSGAIEQDANRVLFLHASDDDRREGIVRLTVAKNRGGPLRDPLSDSETHRLVYTGARFSFAEVA